MPKVVRPGLLFPALLLLASCGRSRTEKLLLDKTWRVYDVTPPQTGTFDVDASNEAEELKNGFYKNASFEFQTSGIFIATFSGKPDSGKFRIGYDGKIISLYPLHGDKIYEQIDIQRLTDSTLDFNTLMAKFDMTLHLKKD